MRELLVTQLLIIAVHAQRMMYRHAAAELALRIQKYETGEELCEAIRRLAFNVQLDELRIFGCEASNAAFKLQGHLGLSPLDFRAEAVAVKRKEAMP